MCQIVLNLFYNLSASLPATIGYSTGSVFFLVITVTVTTVGVFMSTLVCPYSKWKNKNVSYDEITFATRGPLLVG